MADKKLDVETLVAALDTERQEQGMSWRQVADATGVSASTLTRMQQGKRPDVDTFAALVQWLGIPADEFLLAPEGDRKSNRPSSRASTLLRAKKELSAGAADALMELLRAAERFQAEVEPKKRGRKK